MRWNYIKNSFLDYLLKNILWSKKFWNTFSDMFLEPFDEGLPPSEVQFPKWDETKLKALFCFQRDAQGWDTNNAKYIRQSGYFQLGDLGFSYPTELATCLFQIRSFCYILWSGAWKLDCARNRSLGDTRKLGQVGFWCKHLHLMPMFRRACSLPYVMYHGCLSRKHTF